MPESHECFGALFQTCWGYDPWVPTSTSTREAQLVRWHWGILFFLSWSHPITIHPHFLWHLTSSRLQMHVKSLCSGSYRDWCWRTRNGQAGLPQGLKDTVGIWAKEVEGFAWLCMKVHLVEPIIKYFGGSIKVVGLPEDSRRFIKLYIYIYYIIIIL